MKAQILAFGELLVDLIPGEENEGIGEPGTVLKTASGSSGIFACACAGLGGNSGILAKLGVDSLSKFVINEIKKYNVDLSRLIVSDEGQIGLAFVEYKGDVRNYQYYRHHSVGSRIRPDEINIKSLQSAAFVHFPGMLIELSDEVQACCKILMELAEAGQIRLSFDPNIRRELMQKEGARDRMQKAVSAAYVISPSFEEAKYITGKEKLREVVEALHAMGPQVVAITRDKDGLVISRDGQMAIAQGIPVKAVDPTGAGDTVAAALCVGLQEQMSLEELACFCNCAGAIEVQKRGAIGLALPERSETIRLMSSGVCKVTIERV